MPAVQVKAFSLDQPDRTGTQMLEALKVLGPASEIPRKLVKILTDYYLRYTADGMPVFAGGSYFETDGHEPTEEQRGLDIVDSYGISITLSLATIGFIKVYRTTTERKDVLTAATALEEMANTRLSAAMVGLLRSFSLSDFDVDSPRARNLVRTVNQGRLPETHVIAELQRELRQTTASFREVLIGSGTDKAEQIDSPDTLYECGWSWGIVKDADIVDTTEAVGEQRNGVAEDAPYLYFTVVAMDAIEDLFSERTRILGLLNEEQQRLSRALQLRSDLTRAYWGTVATFRRGAQWPLEDIPWRTTDGDESEYFTLQVTSLALKDMANSRGSDADVIRVGAVLNELANRARITRRPVSQDVAMKLHATGVKFPLVGSEVVGKTNLTWSVLEFAPLLLQRLIGIAGMLSDARRSSAVLEMADRIWDHLTERRLRTPAENLWDRPQGAFPMLVGDANDKPSWYYTERVVQALVVTANLLDRSPLRSDRMAATAAELLNEADQIFDNELMRGSAGGGPVLQDRVKEIRVTLRRARESMADRPGTAAALSSHALILLDDLAAGRQNASEVD